MILRRMFDVAMKHDYRIRTNPFDGLKTLRQPKNIGRNELTVEQVNKLIECASKRGEHVKMLFLMGVYTGMRKSDICTLKWNSIDFKNNLIRILPMKTRKNGVHAVIPIHEKVKEILQSVEKGESEYVFPRLEDMYKKHTLTYQITKTFKEAGIQTIVKIGDGKERVVSGFHALRVFFASNCAREGMPIKQVMTMLGHTKVDMSLHYTSAQETDLRLPDFEDSERRVTLKKEVYELLMKYCGSADINDFITGLLKNGSVPTTATMMKLKEDEELDELIEEVM